VTSASRFTFDKVCIVPKLKGKKLKGAKKALQKADCRLGKVRPKGQTTGKVKHQSRKVGKVLPAASKVNITL
jgi:beta-lactam-binding protein with PASTA domain